MKNLMIWLEDQKDLEGKTYITGKNNKSIYSNVFKNDYKNIDGYIGRKIKEKDILDKLNKVNKGIEIYEKKIRVFIKIAQILKIK